MSVLRLARLLLTSSYAAGPPSAAGLIGVTASFVGSFSSSTARPTSHSLSSALPLNFQPSRVRPLKGRTTSSLAAPAHGASTRASRPRAASSGGQGERGMGLLLVVGGSGGTRGFYPFGRETGHEK